MTKKLILTALLCCTCLILSAQDTSATDTSLLDKVLMWYDANTNYVSIAALMAVESSFIPFPSEVVIPPAAYIASDTSSSLTVWGVILAGTLGALLGALINYFLSIALGRPIIYRFAESKLGHLCLLNRQKIEKAEAYFVAHGNSSTLIGRLIPGIRQLISIPAGLARMPLGNFVLYTTLGAALWNGVLALLGYLAHGQKELIHQYSHELSVVLLAILGLVIVYFVAKYVYKKYKNRD